MKDKVRVGVVGTSRYTDVFHLSVLKGHNQADLAAICGRNPERNAEMAAKHGILQVYNDYRAMIEEGELDAIVVSTPDDLHYPIIMRALEAGLHVLCEKPLAMNAQHAKEMLDTAEARGLVHMAMFEWRDIPEVRQMVEIIRRGDLGKIHGFSSRHHLGFLRSSDYAWRIDAAHGNGVLGDLGSHMIDRVRLMIGEITRVSAHLACHYQRNRPDGQPFEPSNDSATLLVEFANGAHGTMEFSYVTSDPDGVQHLVSGTEGTLKSTIFSKNEGVWVAPNGEEDYRQVTVDERFQGGCDPAGSIWDRSSTMLQTASIGTRRFIDAILGKEKVDSTFYDGWKTQLVVDAALESHRTGMWIKVGN